MLWDFFIKEEHMDEVNRLRSSVLQLRQFFEHMQMHKIAEWIHLVGGLDFTKLKAATAFQRVAETGKAEVERIEERSRKQVSKPKKKESKDGSKW